MKIYTKTGDDGTTSLFDGTRVLKSDDRIDAYGHVDELNSVMGIASSFFDHPDFQNMVQTIQRNLFAIGAQLANPSHKKQKAKADFGKEHFEFLEKKIDELEAELKPLTNFILPGGHASASFLHLARTVCRRAERHAVALSKKTTIDSNVIIYLNRLSDFLFVLGRWVNHKNNLKDIPWE